MFTDNLKKTIRAVDLAVQAGRKWQSPRTGMVHLFPNEDSCDTIPLYENFCFVLALFRQKNAESIQEAKVLLERLLAFYSEGNFPVYLHEYPRCYDGKQSLKIAPVFVYLLRDFSSVLSEELKRRMREILEQIPRPEHLFWENRYRAIRGEALLPFDPTSLSSLQWAEWIVTCQLAGQNHFSLPYDEELQLFLPQEEVQEKTWAKPNPIEWLLAEPNYSPALLKNHPHQLFAALLFSCTYEKIDVSPLHFRKFWKGGLNVYAESLTVDLEERIIDRNDIFEASIFCCIGAELLVNGRKATTFLLNDSITIRMGEKNVQVSFSLTSGSGDFFGHIFKANRPTQQTSKGSYEAYDWQIGLRTLRRSPQAQMQIQVKEI